LRIQSPGADGRKGEVGDVGPMRTKADKGEGGSVLADILRMSFIDDPQVFFLCISLLITCAAHWLLSQCSHAIYGSLGLSATSTACTPIGRKCPKSTGGRIRRSRSRNVWV